MTKDTSDHDQYRNDLNNTVDDGGGCVDMWETMSDVRNRREEENGESSGLWSLFNRRGFLKKAGLASGLGLFGASGQAGASTNSKPSEPDVEPLTGAEGQRVIQTLKSTDEYQKLVEYARSKENTIKSDVSSVVGNKQVARIKREDSALRNSVFRS